jgi:hypothetical protein
VWKICDFELNKGEKIFARLLHSFKLFKLKIKVLVIHGVHRTTDRAGRARAPGPAWALGDTENKQGARPAQFPGRCRKQDAHPTRFFDGARMKTPALPGFLGGAQKKTPALTVFSGES